MSPDPLRILILEDVPMDAELVEYELEPSPDPLRVPAGRYPGAVPGRARGLPAGRHPLGLHPAPLRRHGRPVARPRAYAPAMPFLIVTGSVNEETAVGCMKAGATDYLLKSNLARIGPAIEGALARVRARAEKARAEEALRRSEANLRAIFNNSLQAFVLVDRGRDHPGAELAPPREWSARLLRPPAGGGRSHRRLHPRGRRRRSRRRWPARRRNVERRFRDADGAESLVRDHPCAGGGRGAATSSACASTPGT